MINLQLKEKYSNELNSLTVIYPNFNQKGLGDILYRKILKQNPLIASSRLTSDILKMQR